MSEQIGRVRDIERRAAAQALREAAQEAFERGDIGKPDGGVEAWVWLRGRADQIERRTVRD